MKILKLLLLFAFITCFSCFVFAEEGLTVEELEADPSKIMAAKPNEALKLIKSNLDLLDNPKVLAEFDKLVSKSPNVVNEPRSLLVKWAKIKGFIPLEGSQIASYNKGVVGTKGAKPS